MSHLISTPATHPLQLAQRLPTASTLPPFTVCPLCITLNLCHCELLLPCLDSACLRCLFLTFFSLTLSACLLPVCLDEGKIKTLELSLLWSQSVQSSGSTPHLLQITHLPHARHPSQGKPSLPSFNVNMRSRQSLNVAPRG